MDDSAIPTLDSKPSSEDMVPDERQKVYFLKRSLSDSGEQGTQNSSAPRISSLDTSAITIAREESPTTAPLSSPLLPPPPTTEHLIEKYIYELTKRLEGDCEIVYLMRVISKMRNDVMPFKDGIAAVDLPWLYCVHDSAVLAMAIEEQRHELALVERFAVPDTDNPTSVDRSMVQNLIVHSLRTLGEELVTRFYEPSYFIRRRYVPSNIRGNIGRLIVYSMESVLECKPDDDLITSTAEIKKMFLEGVDVWITSFLPYLRFVSVTRRHTCFLWNESNFDKSEEAFRLYSLVSRINRLDKEGTARGALFPVSWLQELLNWMCGKQETPPGPFNTFRLVKKDPFTSKLYIRENVPDADVIPEELFDALWASFGGGPKFILRGSFHMREAMQSALQPPRVKISVYFDGLCDNPIELDGVLYRAGLMEVVRRAFFTFCAKPGIVERGSTLLHWRTAVCTIRGFNMSIVRAGGKELDLFCSTFESGTVGMAISNASDTVKCSISDVTSLTLNAFLPSLFQRSATLLISGVCGLTNIGNTCYMNSALQCLSNLRHLRHALFQLPISEYPNAPITTELIALLMDMWSMGMPVADTRELKMAVGCAERRFDHNEQQDAMEFIEVLLDRMHEEMNTVAFKSYRERVDSDKNIPIQELSATFWENFLVNNDSCIPPLFFHQSKTRLECLTCGGTSIVFDNNPTLSAVIAATPRRRTVEVCLLLPYTTETVRTLVRLRVRVPMVDDERITVADIEQEIKVLLDNSCAKENVAEASEDVHTESLVKNTDIPDDKNDNNNNNNNNVVEKSTISEVNKKMRFSMEGFRVVVAPVDSHVSFVDDHLRLAAVIAETNSIPTTPTTIFPATTVDGDNNDTHTPSVPHTTAAISSSLGSNAGPSEVLKDPFFLWFMIRSRDSSLLQRQFCHIEPLPARLPEGHPNTLHYIVARGRALTQELVRRHGPTTSGNGHDNNPSTNEANGNDCASAEDEGRDVRDADTRDGGGDAEGHREEREDSHLMAYRMERAEFIVLYGNYRHAFPLDSTHDACRPDDLSGPELAGFTHHVLLLLDPNTYMTPRVELREVTHPSVDALRRSGYRGGCASGYPNTNYGPRSPYQPEAEVATVSLDACLRSTFLPDTLTGEDALYCGRCKEFRSSRVERSLFLLPPCLLISLKRFKVRLQEASKNNTDVTFPETLDVAPFVDAAAPAQCTRYRLRGVVNHYGSLTFGHYTAIAWNDVTQQWVLFDDSHTSVLTENKWSPNSAYIMCYEREDGLEETKGQYMLHERSRL